MNLFVRIIACAFILLLVGGTILFYQMVHIPDDAAPRISFYRWRSIPFRKKSTTYFSYISNDKEVNSIYLQKIRAKARGGFTEDFPKHNYTIELKDKHNLAKLKEDDDWILGASYLDKTFLRHKISYDLFRSFDKKNKAPECSFVEVFRNLRYHGLYILTERMDAKRLHINRKDTSSCIFKDPPIFYSLEKQVNSNPYKTNDAYHQKFPKLEEINKKGIVEEIRNFITNAPDSIFNHPDKGIVKYMDLENIIDWHILLLITHNDDGLLKNFYLYKTDSLSRFKICPWDYDHSFGRDGDNEKHAPGIIHFSANTLLNRLTATNAHDYNKRLKNRFEQLKKEEILTENNIHLLVSKGYKKIRPLIKKNEERWPTNAVHFYDDNNSDEEIQRINLWISKQLPLCEEYVQGLTTD